MPDNVLYYGDNLDVLRRHVKDESVDLVYLDPPFNSNQNYNVLFAEQDGDRSAAQIKAFTDTWRWDQAAAAEFWEVVEKGGDVAETMLAFKKILGQNDMLAYLSMMAPRLVELRRVLKESGSIYLHCDPTASHYLKLLMDAVFGPQNFRSEIVWKRSTAHSDAKQGRRQHGRLHDVLLFYSRTGAWTWNQLHTTYEAAYVDGKYPYTEPSTERRYGLWDMTGPGGAAKGNPQYEVMGVTRYWRFSRERMEQMIADGRVIQPRPGAVPRQKRYLDESPGVALQDLWSDIDPINSMAQERLGYPTQKPEALLERIVEASSNPGDVVLDPFCGCGTTIAVAQKLGRAWIGIDVTHLAVALIKVRLKDRFGEKAAFNVVGEPVSLDDAAELAKSDPYQFQWWALGLVGARPVDEKKGADKGIDGRVYFQDEKGAAKEIILSVKAGKPQVSHLRDLRGVLDREGAEIGVLISMDEPTQPMRAEAADAGFYSSPGWNSKHPRLQLLTVWEILVGKRIDYPHQTASTFKKAPKHESEQPKSDPLF